MLLSRAAGLSRIQRVGTVQYSIELVQLCNGKQVKAIGVGTNKATAQFSAVGVVQWCIAVQYSA